MVTECPTVPPYSPQFVSAGRALLAGILSDVSMLPFAEAAATLVQERYPVYAAEAEAIADEFDVRAVDVMLANLSYDMILNLFGCSTMALATPDGPVLARNMDWPHEALVARASCVTPTSHGQSAGFAGGIGVVSGLSRRGFAVVLNAVIGGGPPNLDGFPMLLFLRHLLDEATSFDDAVQRSCATPLVSSGLLTLVGTENRQRVCIERGPTHHAERWAEGERPLITTNHYLCLLQQGDCSRYNHLQRHSPRLPARPTADDLLGLLRHDDVRQSITAQHVIAWPATGKLRLFVPSELLRPDYREGDGFQGVRDLF
jgi:isopenicillin-N N-acyltransferase like protein